MNSTGTITMTMTMREVDRLKVIEAVTDTICKGAEDLLRRSWAWASPIESKRKPGTLSGPGKDGRCRRIQTTSPCSTGS
ncbi:hypothetical protein BN2476_470080 [Paraburkholderia piptadeniae]|uniref:Uncharacterized protein n=1 Tax=Paraburkholderia piptadeniae TaxID=1701573 RepID=A0A1N7SE42_9BURK|nr:hypothetical protein BN2476_470080 [Paraburkholderia piptadeniae]